MLNSPVVMELTSDAQIVNDLIVAAGGYMTFEQLDVEVKKKGLTPDRMKKVMDEFTALNMLRNPNQGSPTLGGLKFNFVDDTSERFVKAEIGGTSFLVEGSKRGFFGSDHQIIADEWTPKPGQVCIDGGFGSGTWTLCALARGATVYAFDMLIEYHTQLVTQLRANNFWRYSLICAGLSDKTAPLAFVENSHCVSDKGECISGVSLDDYFATFNPERLDFLNLDVEGHEAEVLRGGRNILRRYKPKIIIELHVRERSDDAARKMMDAVGHELHMCGYVNARPSHGYLIAERN